jgi:hypothetical protein
MGRNGAGGGPVTVMEMDGQATRVMSSVSVEVEVGAGRLYAPKKKNKQSCFLLLLFLSCSGSFIGTEPPDRSIIRELLTAFLYLFVCFVRLPYNLIQAL